ncbi:MAG: GAF domain-containing protein [Chloroflexi bacterium]|nr:GAF domain-containing protein [Chloroflexota bacterium]
MQELDLPDVRVLQAQLHVLSQLLAWSNHEFVSCTTALQALADIVQEEIGYPQFGIGLVGEDGVLRFAAGYGIPDDLKQTLTVAPGQGVVGWVLEHGAPLNVPDITHEPRYRGLFPETRAEVCVPLRTRNQILGVINVESPQGNAFGEDDVLLLTALANGASGILARLLRREHTEQERAERFRQLSPREKQVLRELAAGKSNKDIARALQMKVHTVEHHVTAILKKLELGSRHEAGQWARENRMFENS